MKNWIFLYCFSRKGLQPFTDRRVEFILYFVGENIICFVPVCNFQKKKKLPKEFQINNSVKVKIISYFHFCLKSYRKLSDFSQSSICIRTSQGFLEKGFRITKA